MPLLQGDTAILPSLYFTKAFHPCSYRQPCSWLGLGPWGPRLWHIPAVFINGRTRKKALKYICNKANTVCVCLYSFDKHNTHQYKLDMVHKSITTGAHRSTTKKWQPIKALPTSELMIRLYPFLQFPQRGPVRLLSLKHGSSLDISHAWSLSWL